MLLDIRVQIARFVDGDAHRARLLLPFVLGLVLT